MLLGLNDLIKLRFPTEISRATDKSIYRVCCSVYTEHGEVYSYLTGVVVTQRRQRLANTDMQYTCFIHDWRANY